MKTLIAAAGLLVIGTTVASAQFAPRPWHREHHPYQQRHHSVCQEKAFRLHNYERRAASDGRLSWSERRTVAALRRDLDRTCARFRWRD